MKNTQVLSYVLALIMLLVSESSYATLINRGGGLIYDDVLNVTWLANTNLGAGSVYDDGFSSTDGLMFGASAINWADQLSHGGFDDWRLPKATYTNSAGQSCHYYCTDSELG